MRLIKITLAIFVSLFCLFYATQNVWNMNAGHWFVGYMASMEGHEGYPAHFGPAITSPTLVWIMFGFIVALEYLAGLFAARGAWDMWQARSETADIFNDAKSYALIACGVGIIIWFGIFHAIGGAYFQMWQVEAGRGPFVDSAHFSLQMGMIFLVLNSQDK